MDILIKLRVYLWLMVISLWGLMIYQFVEDEGGDLPQMHWLSKARSQPRPPSTQPQDQIPAKDLFPKPQEDLLTEPVPVSGTHHPTVDATGALPGALPARPQAPAPDATTLVAKLPDTKPPPRTQPIVPPDEPAPPVRPDLPPPKGFFKPQARHFVIFSEGEEAAPDFVETIENLHANLMLDLAAFSPWARDEKVTIYLFRGQESYRKVTGRPSWSGGASSVKSRKIFLYESDESVGILAHELCHIYFDSFFLGGKTNPLWLSEGMATLVQTERGLSAPNWLKENMGLIRKGGGYQLSEMLTVENTTAADDASVRLWYTQSYSVVRFLIRAQYKSSFLRFCRHIRDGFPIHEALYRAYGMPFNRVKALEYAWRHDLQSSKL